MNDPKVVLGITCSGIPKMKLMALLTIYSFCKQIDNQNLYIKIVTDKIEVFKEIKILIKLLIPKK